MAAIAYDRERRVVYANAAARRLLGEAVFAELAPLVEQMPLRPALVQLADGRTLRVHGIQATDDEPAVLFADDVSDEVQHDRVMHEFLRNAAHQLRTPLAGIAAAVETLQSGAKERPADRDRFLDHVQVHADRLSRIVRSLLMLARAEAGAPIAIETVELAPLLHGIVGEAETRDGVEISTTCTRGLAVLAAPDLLHEVLVALVDNAITHTQRGGIAVRARRTDGRAVITVADSGPGIPPELHERIFEPFFRVASTGEGFGLGLTIAAHAVRAMDGDLGVSSTVGTGTTFTVSLPAASHVR